MDEQAVIGYLTESFGGLDVIEADRDYYFFYDPDRSLDPARRMPFATIVTGDRHDTVSRLDRPGVFCLNVDAGKDAFRAMFGADPPKDDYDFAVLDRIVPHPVYGTMFWVRILNPGERTFRDVKTLLTGAYERAQRRAERTRRGETSAIPGGPD